MAKPAEIITARTLREKQSVFARYVAKLIQQADALGYDVTLGEAWRSPEEAKRLAKAGLGIIGSLHEQRLAIDLLLFKAGIYLTESTDYEPLGQWWEAQSGDGIRCAWGGRFTRADGNHFSFAHGGKA